jgi:hypothetical protein
VGGAANVGGAACPGAAKEAVVEVPSSACPANVGGGACPGAGKEAVVEVPSSPGLVLH